MKKTLKTLGLALVTSISFAACTGNGSGGSADSSKVDSSTSVSSSTDTLIKTDSAARDTGALAPDSPAVKVDTLSKTIKKTTVVKKSVVKKP